MGTPGPRIFLGRSTWLLLLAGLVLLKLASLLASTIARNRRSSALAAVADAYQPWARPAAETGPGGERVVRVLTYNVQFLVGVTEWVSWIFGFWPNTKARAEAIGAAVAGYDIVCLQEAQRTSRRRQIFGMAQNVAMLRSGSLKPVFHEIDGPDGTSWNKQHSGLACLTRFPILDTKTTVYRDCTGIDCFLDKGVLYMKLGMDNGKPLHVLNTHTIPSPESIQWSQVDDMETFLINLDIRKDEPVLFVGDFNIPGPTGRVNKSATDRTSYSSVEPTPAPIPDVYDHLAKVMGSNGLVDLWPPKQPGFTNKEQNKRIDYIWGRMASYFTTQDGNYIHERKMEDKTGVGNMGMLSDHFAVEATFVMRS